MTLSKSYHMGFNDVDFSGADYDLIITRSPYALSPSSTIPTMSSPYNPGSYGGDRYPNGREFGVGVLVSGSSASDLKSNLDNIMLVLNEAAPKKLEFGVQSDRYWMAQLSGGSEVRYVGNNEAEFDLHFFCPDPHAFADSATNVSDTAAASPHTTTVTSASHITGSAATRPIITLNPSNSPADITIENDLTGETATYGTSYTTGASNRIRLHCGLFRWQTSTDSGSTWSDAMGSSSGTFFELLPGQDNDIIITGPTGGDIDIDFTNRYL